MLETNTRIRTKHKGVAEDAGGRSPANGRRRCRVRQREDGVHDVGGNRSPSQHSLVILVSPCTSQYPRGSMLTAWSTAGLERPMSVIQE